MTEPRAGEESTQFESEVVHRAGENVKAQGAVMHTLPSTPHPGQNASAAYAGKRSDSKPIPEERAWREATEDAIKAEVATLTAAEQGPAWGRVYEICGELPAPEKEVWKIAALLNRRLAAQPSVQRDEDGASLIQQERRRQIETEGWTPDHDDNHADESLAKAAACYAYTDSFHAYIAEYAENGGRDLIAHVPRAWPWHRDWWKPGPDRVRELVKAGALLAAEIDRLKRITAERGSK